MFQIKKFNCYMWSIETPTKTVKDLWGHGFIMFEKPFHIGLQLLSESCYFYLQNVQLFCLLFKRGIPMDSLLFLSFWRIAVVITEC